MSAPLRMPRGNCVAGWHKTILTSRSIIYQLPKAGRIDPNGVTFDPHSGLYHRFFQYDKTYDEGCKHGAPPTTCGKYGYEGQNINARVWGHSVSKDLATWAAWPGIDADSEWDQKAVFSGNCVLDDAGVAVCIYSGARLQPCDTGTCAYSQDWLHWTKTGCMRHAPSAACLRSIMTPRSSAAAVSGSF